MREHSVLVVDDEPIVRESIRDWLVEAGYHVATAETGEQALEMVRLQDFSVLVVDLRLPGKTGIKVLEAVKAERPWIRTIVITAYPSAETAQEAKRLGAIDYLLKPFSPDSLERLIDDTLSAIPPEATVTTAEEPTPVVPIPEAVEVKQTWVIDDEDLRLLFNALKAKMDVIGVVAKERRFVFGHVKRFEDLRLDYDVTIQPPTRFLLPERETLLKLRLGKTPKAEPTLDTTPRVLFGVHPYDIKAIELLDEVFMSVYPDPHYITRRQNTLIIGVDCLHPSPHSFASSMGTHQTENGFDLLLTDVGGAYMVMVGSRRGAELLAQHTEAQKPSAEGIATQKALHDAAVESFALHLDVARERLPKLLEDHYDHPYWVERSEACLPDIASPVEAFNAIAEAAKAEAARRLIEKVSPEPNLYAPQPAKLLRVENLTPSEKVFEFQLEKGKILGHRPGQFIEVSVMGIGEAPISVASTPTRDETFQLAIRNVGNVTRALHNLDVGAVVGIRGPFGNGFPIESLEGKDLLLIAGGIGLFPLRSLIQYVMDRREAFGRVVILFGVRSPKERVFTLELEAWREEPSVEFHETVDRGDESWEGHIGVITTLIPGIEISPARTMAVVVGPPIMYRFVVGELKKKGLADEQIILSLERRMKCGIGKCGHCQIDGVYVCQEGPVFTLAQLRNLREAV